jgi:hypothetical protein
LGQVTCHVHVCAHAGALVVDQTPSGEVSWVECVSNQTSSREVSWVECVSIVLSLGFHLGGARESVACNAWCARCMVVRCGVVCAAVCQALWRRAAIASFIDPHVAAKRGNVSRGTVVPCCWGCVGCVAYLGLLYVPSRSIAPEIASWA